MEDFKIRLVQHLLDRLVGQDESFEQLLRHSLNCDPAVLLHTLQDMEQRGLVLSRPQALQLQYSLTGLGRESVSAHGRRLVASVPGKAGFGGILRSRYFGGLVRAVLSSLPKPTPVYSQWWFSEQAYTRLTNHLLGLLRANAHVAFVGSSSLGAVFSNCTKAAVTIIDVDQVLLQRIAVHVSKKTELVNHDVSRSLDKPLRKTFDVVVVDPPWSSSDLRTFLVRGSMLLRDGGVLVISFPPIFTRPSAQVEQQSLLKLADEIGLSLVKSLPGFTEYSVPSFERHAYERHGITLRRPWRRGDVFLFVKCRDRKNGSDLAIRENTVWDQYDYGKTRLFLKKNGSAVDGPASVLPVEGRSDFHYDSTSSRSALWRQASLVSTENHIASVSGRRHLALLLQRIQTAITSTGSDIQLHRIVAPQAEAVLSPFLSSLIERGHQGEEVTWQRQRERNSRESLRI